jgi:hypothetical protein
VPGDACAGTHPGGLRGKRGVGTCPTLLLTTPSNHPRRCLRVERCGPWQHVCQQVIDSDLLPARDNAGWCAGHALQPCAAAAAHWVQGRPATTVGPAGPRSACPSTFVHRLIVRHAGEQETCGHTHVSAACTPPSATCLMPWWQRQHAPAWTAGQHLLQRHTARRGRARLNAPPHNNDPHPSTTLGSGHEQHQRLRGPSTAHPA